MSDGLSLTEHLLYTIGSMYGIFTHIWLISIVSVGKLYHTWTLWVYLVLIMGLKNHISMLVLREVDWQFKYFFMCSPIPGEMIQFDEHIFPDGLVQPPTR